MDAMIHGYSLKDKFTTAKGHKWSETPLSFYLCYNEPPQKGQWIFIPRAFFNPDTEGCKPNEDGVVDLTKKHLDRFSSNSVDHYKSAQVQDVVYIHSAPGYLPSLHVYTDGFR